MHSSSLLAGFAASLVFAACQPGWSMTIKSVSASHYHVAVLRDDGTVWTWGDNSTGKLGDGSTSTRSAPAKVLGLSDVKAIATSYFSTIAIKSDGTVWEVKNRTMAQIPGLSGIVEIVGGYYHSVALKDDGTVWAWGQNQFGQLGDGTKITRNTPIQVPGMTGVVSIAAGYDATLAVKDDGTVWAWGANSNGQLGDGTTTQRLTPVRVTALSGIKSVSAGSSYSVALAQDGTVWAWGSNNYGQVGNGTTSLPVTTPLQVSGLSNIAQVSAGYDHCLARTNSGGVWGWGRNYAGQVGSGNTLSAKSPVPSPVLNGLKLISGGAYMSAGLKEDGTVLLWGNNASGQMADGVPAFRTIPVKILGVTSQGICAGQTCVASLDAGGKIWMWGGNYHGGLGDGTDVSRAAPVQVQGMSGAVSVSIGDYHTLALKSDGTLWGWGSNLYNELFEDEPPSRVLPPARVTDFSDIISAAAGQFFTVVARSDGSVWGWGSNRGGQLGDGTTTDRPAPVQVAGIDNVKSVAAGYLFTIALKNDGTVWGWGANSNGQLGDGTQITRLTPVQTAGLDNIVAVAAGTWAMVALRSDGTVWTTGIAGGFTQAMQVIGLSEIVAVACGVDHYLALKADGTVWAWSSNRDGQLGDTSTLNRSTPVQVDGLTGVVAIGAGNGYSLALKDDHTLWAWGSDRYGIMVDGRQFESVRPVSPVWDTAAPEGTVGLNRGATEAASSAVLLRLRAEDNSGSVNQMIISNDGVFDTETWETYDTTKNWTLEPGTGPRTVYVKFRDAATNESPAATAIVNVREAASVSAARTAAVGSEVVLAGNVVTAHFPDCLYVQAPDRSSAVKVSPVPDGVYAGRLLDMIGVVSILDDEKTVTPLVWHTYGIMIVSPLLMSTSALGGGDCLFDPLTGAGQEGVGEWRWTEQSDGGRHLEWVKACGVNTIGLLVKTWGRVVEVDQPEAPARPAWFRVSDGSANTVKVVVPEGVDCPEQDTMVKVTGICSCERQSEKLVRVLKVRSRWDIGS